MTIRIVGTREGRRLNSIYRGKDEATNVLSFGYGTSGDVVLCHPLIAREARDQRKPLAGHYAHLVVHGMLHLRGHDHRRATDASRMERKEILLLARLGFGDPYAVK